MNRKPRPSYLRLVTSENVQAKWLPPAYIAETDPPRSVREGRWYVVLYRRLLPDRYRLRFDDGTATVFDTWLNRFVFNGRSVESYDDAEKYANRRNFCWRYDLEFYWSNHE